MCRDFLPRSHSGRPVPCILRVALPLGLLAALSGPLAVLSGADKPAPPAKKSAASAPAGGQAAGASGAPLHAEPQKPEVLAIINGEEIKRDELGKECLKRYGDEVLDSLVHREMILDYCRANNVVVTEKEIDDEIERMAKQFKLPKDQWLRLLEKERGIKPRQYAKEIIWPTLALRKLSATDLTISQQELDEAFESQFGPAVKARIIVCGNAKDAAKVRAEALAAPDKFPALARKYSEDSASASSGGLMPPIRHFMGDAGFEKAAFNLKVDEISPVVPVGKQFVVLKCEGRLPAEKIDRKYADAQIVEALEGAQAPQDRQGKVRRAGKEVDRRNRLRRSRQGKAEARRRRRAQRPPDRAPRLERGLHRPPRQRSAGKAPRPPVARADAAEAEAERHRGRRRR